MSHKRIVAAALFLLVTGCNSASPGESAPLRSALIKQSGTSLATADAEVPGYRHNFSASHFHIGANVVTISDGTINKMVGSEGVFATLISTGAVDAVPNATSSAMSVGPLSADPDAHSAAVQAYFVGAGLPADQLGTLLIRSYMQGNAPRSDPYSPPQFVGYATSIQRVVSGYLVLGSQAMARINANNEVVDESVYWPPIPSVVVSDAVQLSAILNDPTNGPLYTGSLPAGTPMGVRIHHSGAHWYGGFSAYASYDLRVGSQVLNFDSTGNQVHLPEQDAVGPGNTQ